MDEITKKGNPRKPCGDEGAEMLKRMTDTHAPVTEWALGFFDFREDDHVLDIGCGGGAALKRMAENIRTGFLIGVDYSPVAVKLSRELNQGDMLAGKMDIIEASVEGLPFDDDMFDKATTIESFYFWPDPLNNLKEVLRVLKPGGVLLVIADIYNKDGLDETAKSYVEEYRMFNPTRDEFMKLFLDAGFSDVKIHTVDDHDWICVEGIK